MGRYNLSRTVPSQEGFLDSVGKFLKEVGSGIHRANVIGSIAFKPGKQPEVNGVAAKDFQSLTMMIRNAIETGQVWDVTLLTGRSVTLYKPDFNNEPDIVWSTVVIIGQGNQVKVRLPGYEPGEPSASAAYFLINELNLNRVV